MFHKILIHTASLGGIDKHNDNLPQSLSADFYRFDDSNFPLRHKALTARLQAKIPKMFGWQLKPGYDTYLWLDGNITLSNPESLKYFYDQLEDYEFLVLRHPTRPNIRQETRYLRKGLREQSRYLVGRYDGEWTPEQSQIFEKDQDYIDDLLVIGGVFMYRPTDKVKEIMKEWWYYTTRYSVFDQLSFTYVLKTSGVRYKVIDENFNKSEYLKIRGHKTHDT